MGEIFFEISFFLFAFFLGKEILPYFKILPSYSSPSSFGFLLSFLFISFLFFWIIKALKSSEKRKFFFLFLFVFSSLFGLNLVFSAFSPSLSFFFSLILILIWFLWPKVFIHDLIVILALTGISALFSFSFSPESFLVLLFLLSLYDFISVFVTKHMVKMAKAMIGAEIFYGILLPKNFSGFLEEIKGEKKDFSFLGGGDIAFPLMLCFSFLRQSFWQGLVLAIFISLGLAFSFLILKKTKKPIPALCPIFLFALFGFLILKILWRNPF